jgi:hypothetical protein
MGARRTAGVVAGVLTVGAVAAAIAVFNLPKAQSSPNTADNPPVSTAEITKETLIDRENHDGTLAHGDPTTISSRGNGTVTGLPAEGATVSRGKALSSTSTTSLSPCSTVRCRPIARSRRA